MTTVDPDLIRQLAEIMDETGLTEIEIGENGRTIRVARGGAMVAQVPQAMAMPATTGTAPAGDAGATGAEEGGFAPGSTVTSPMVGTAYLSPDPSSAPFVSVGDSVAEGQTVMIVEAMKVMNQIKAHKSGRIARIMVDDAQPVEYGDVLVVIE